MSGRTPTSPALPKLRLEFTAPGSKPSDRLARVGVGRAFDLDALGAWTLGELPNHVWETPYQGVRATLVEEEVVEPDALEAAPRSRADASAALREAVRRAVERACGSARRVAVMAGGGLDSAVILALAVEIARSRGGSAFGVAFDYRADGDDRPHLRALEEHLNCEIVRIPPEAASERRCLLGGVDGAPFNLATGPLEVEAIARARAYGAEVVLTGAGGDELLDGEPHSLSRLLRRGEVREAVRAARALRGFEWTGRSLTGWLARPLLAPHLPRQLRMWKARRMRAYVPEWAGPSLRASRERARDQSLAVLADRISRKEPPERAPTEIYRVFYAWYRHHHEVTTGLPRRDPYLDRALVKFVHRLPPEWLLLGDVRRGLFRDAMRGVLPESLRMRDDKATFEPAMFRWVESVGGFESFCHLTTMERLAALGLVIPAKFTEAFDELARAPMTSYGWWAVWSALCVESFLRARDSS
ncbi:MAG: Asparagine synthetase [Labilithrix sp.]|nr:Asparagine synthetase [Labilithrix sp.]